MGLQVSELRLPSSARRSEPRRHRPGPRGDSGDRLRRGAYHGGRESLRSGTPLAIAMAALAACERAGGGARSAPPRILETDKLVAVAARAPEPTSVAGARAHIYFAAVDTVWRVPLAGGEPQKLVASASPSLAPFAGSAMDDRSVLWPDRGLPPHEATVRLVPKEGGDATSSATLPRGGPGLGGRVRQNVYFSALDGTIREAPKGGGPSRVLARGQWNLAGLHADETGVYWAVRGDGGEHGAVRRVNRGGVELPLADAMGAIGGIALDATCVYFTDRGDGTIKMVWRDGGHIAEMATGLERPASIVVDDLTRTLYFLTDGLSTEEGQAPVLGTGGLWKMSAVDEELPTQLAADLTQPRSLALIGDPNEAPGLAWTQLFNAAGPEGKRRGTVFKMAR